MDGQKQPLYRLEVAEALVELRSQADGLSASEADLRLEKQGPNTLEIKHKESHFVTYAKQFKDLMVLLLVASSVLSFVLGDARTAVVLLALVIFNTTIGFLQEFKASRVMESLKRLVV
ncbi:MAG: cation-transporting P-type ATPase, partial [Candidatus Saccharimonadales bacterium]